MLSTKTTSKRKNFNLIQGVGEKSKNEQKGEAPIENIKSQADLGKHSSSIVRNNQRRRYRKKRHLMML